MTSIEGRIANGERKKISFENGLITGVDESDGSADNIFSDSCVIFPGFVDAHVHAREDATGKWSHKEDFFSAGKASIHGGVTAFMEMPNTPTPTVARKQVDERRKLAEKSEVPIVICAGINVTSAPIEGVNNYKAFLTKSVGDLFFDDYAAFELQVRLYSKKTIHIHCEDHATIEHDSTRPPNAEVIAVSVALNIIRRENLRAHICHVSTAEATALIRKAKQDGVNVTTEVTPHHLFFDTDNVKSFERAAFIKMNPPLRSNYDRISLIEALRDGTIDALATDHAPHTVEEKKVSNPSGVPHLDTFGPFVTWLLKENGFSEKRIADCCAKFPARLLRLNQGEISIGKDASFTVLDLSEPSVVKKEELKTKCAWSPFEGVSFPGKVHATIVKGKIFNQIVS